MGLKCSVLGHKYGDATVERDREEQGSEVVITIREMETCDRCGTERVVSENKEVTSIATPDEPADAATDAPDASTDDADAAADEGGSDTVEPNETTADEAADPADADASTDPAGDRSGDVTDPAGDGPVADASPPVESNEGAEILDAESDDPVTDDELADPSIGDATDDDPPATESVEEDAVIIGDEDETDEEAAGGRELGEWPDEPADEHDEPEWTPSDALDEDPIDAPDAGTDENTAVTVPDGQFRCPECDYTTPVEASSLRAGDFCPDCHKGSLVHEPRD